jgi:hypothetical protein
MSRSHALMFSTCLVAGMCLAAMGEDKQKSQEGQAKEASKTPAAQIEDFVIGDPIRHKNLTIFPITSKTAKTEDRFMTLEEGLKSGKVQVFEVGAEPGRQRQSATTRRQIDTNQQARGDNDSSQDPFPGGEGIGDVNRLMVLNGSGKPLYLMPGEIIYGGQQDRCIAEEAIISANSKPTAVKVFCVEQGRWAQRESAETAAALSIMAGTAAEDAIDEQTAQKLSKEAKEGKFVAHAGSLNKKGRMAVQEGKGQGEVWDKVSETNAASGISSRSSAFTANYTSREMTEKLQAYIKELQTPVGDRKQIVGVILAINGKAEAVDIFQSTPLFKKLWPKLLKSYTLDAIAQAQDKSADKTCTDKDAKEFLLATMQGDTEKQKTSQGGLVVTKRDSPSVISFSVSAPEESRGMGGSAGEVHKSGFSK